MLKKKAVVSKKEKKVDIVNPKISLSALNIALDKSKKAELLMAALRGVADIEGISRLSKNSGVDRAHLYTLLTKAGDPRLSTLSSILDALGFKLSLKRK